MYVWIRGDCCESEFVGGCCKSGFLGIGDCRKSGFFRIVASLCSNTRAYTRTRTRKRTRARTHARTQPHTYACMRGLHLHLQVWFVRDCCKPGFVGRAVNLNSKGCCKSGFVGMAESGFGDYCQSGFFGIIASLGSWRLRHLGHNKK